MIETRGLTAAVEALDAMAKAANVQLTSFKKVGSGLVTVIIEEMWLPFRPPLKWAGRLTFKQGESSSHRM